MGQGSITFRDSILNNCRESFLAAIVDRIELAEILAESDALAGVIRHWREQVDTMPPGCVHIEIDSLELRSDDVKRLTKLIQTAGRGLAESGMVGSSNEAQRIAEFLQQPNKGEQDADDQLPARAESKAL